MHEPLEGIAAADALLGRPFPLPSAPLPLVSYVEIARVSERGAEVAWNLDDSRPDSRGRLALYAGLEPPPARELPDAGPPREREGRTWRTASLPDAQPSLRPVHEVTWRAGGLHLRLTAQGPWDEPALAALAASVVV